MTKAAVQLDHRGVVVIADIRPLAAPATVCRPLPPAGWQAVGPLDVPEIAQLEH